MKTKALLIAAAAAELGTGLGLLVVPSFLSQLLLGEGLGSTVSALVGRVAGAALVSIGLACCFESAGRRAGSPKGLLVALLLYNAIVALLLTHGALYRGVHGLLLWPVVVVHVAFAIWCTASIRSEGGAAWLHESLVRPRRPT
ncbi:multisubunit Na+/H+ antiporter MnhG subunit [Lysobacter niastensis]|uniref:Multisubunit Na+/H+ antiporter MnhG subunit n=1 Tax=Lysobacter niastensis TaxID=380629 RepID=A0ABU1W6J8_9GAMM|nr:hypothetical protein [Lysobacter niastensis]MDR7133208.1 multisubunit Na+/H+ antiporter MnhG subunit [Lysobacter niastensis]